MRSFIGKVVSDRMQKSVVVAVDRLFQHPKYPRTVKRTKKFMVRDDAARARPPRRRCGGRNGDAGGSVSSHTSACHAVGGGAPFRTR